ncbi:MAG: hypothetical protein ACXAC8_18135 [Candidatus Hodarchaeales archaeon]|jgi:hypothetical protein
MVRVYEKYGWVLYLALGLLWLIVGFAQAFFPDELLNSESLLVLDMSWSELEISNPEGAELVRFYIGGLGHLKINWSLLVLVITLTGFRRGEKWAWYTLWLVPILLVSNALFNASWFGRIDESLQFIPITTLSILGLLLPYRTFFTESHFRRMLARLKGQTSDVITE